MSEEREVKEGEPKSATAEGPPEQPKPKPKPKPKAKRVTAKVLRAAARTTADIKDIVAAETRSRAKRDGKQSSVFALAQEMHESGAGKVNGDPDAARPEAGPAPDDGGQAAPPSTAQTHDRVARAQRGTTQSSAAQPRGAGASARAPSPQPTAATRPSPLARARRPPPPPAAHEVATAATAPSAPSPATSGALILLAAATFTAGILVAWSLQNQSEALRALAGHQAKPPPANPTPPPPAQASGPIQSLSTGALAEIGDGRVVYADGSGRLIVLRKDPTSAELEIERVYTLVHDPGRGQGQPNRHYHGYYLDDLEGQLKASLEAAFRRYEAAMTHAARTYTDVDKADAAAIELVAAGGADRLTQYLGPSATALRRRTAVVALAEGGYLRAVEPLLGLLEDHARNPKFFAHLTELASRLTAQELDPSDPQAVLAALRAWLAANTNHDPFARIKDR